MHLEVVAPGRGHLNMLNVASHREELLQKTEVHGVGDILDVSEGDEVEVLGDVAEVGMGGGVLGVRLVGNVQEHLVDSALLRTVAILFEDDLADVAGQGRMFVDTAQVVGKG